MPVVIPTKLGEVMSFQNGRAFKTSEWEESGFPIIRIQNLNNSEAGYNFYNGQFDNRVLVEVGDLLFSWSGTVGTSFGPHLWMGPSALLNQHIFKIGIKKGIEKSYAFYALKNITKEIESKVNGSVGLTHITKSKMLNFEIPLHSLEKQREIIEKLDKAFAEIDASIEASMSILENIQLIFDSYLDTLVQEQISIIGEKKLVDVLDIARGGSPRPIKNFLTNDPEGINWVKISDASASKKYIRQTSQRIKQSGVNRSRIVNPGDFLLSNSMSFGRPYIMATTGCIHDGWLVLSNNKKLLNPDYLYYLLGSKFVFNQFNRSAAGSTVRNLNISLAGDVTFPVPSLEVQEQFVDRVSLMEELLEHLKRITFAKLILLRDLRSSLLADAFAGDSVLPRVA